MMISVFDVETTGLDPETDRIVEIGIVKFKDFEKVSSFNEIVWPRKSSSYIPQEAVRIHGITEEMVRKSGVPWGDIAESVKDELESSDIWCAYNASFDIAFIKNALRGVGIEVEDRPVIDPLRVVQRFIPYNTLKRKGLGSVAKFLDVKLDRAHRAEDDAAATGVVLRRLCEELGLKAGDLVGHRPTCLGKWIMDEDYVDVFRSTYSCLSRKYQKRRK